ncbi:organomercurial lyase [Streptacidiphilus cavernicola]|uniref:Organomercurial lyase n=1 Tax=Streptacidiphilus cavernicola TaxID=3342716 RepID=A0ABV6VVD0_9ACTN
MRITVLTVPDCPNGPVVQERITAALDGRDVRVHLVEVSDQDQAARWGMTGSPTVLLDGVDPFAVPGADPSVSCRLYRGADGRVEGSPGVEDLRRALDSAGPPATVEARQALVVDVLDPVGRGGRGRLAPVERGLRAVQQAVLGHFATTGQAPDAAVLAPAAAPSGRPVAEVLAELADQDFLTLDDQGQIRAAYPFSAVPTAHQATIAGGAVVWSMCAIDALGIPAMVGADAVISSADPVTGEAVTVSSTDGRMVWEPAGAVVFVGRRCCEGAAAAVCCDVLNFFTSPASARQWADSHPDVVGDVVDQDQAVALGVGIFGGLLETTTAG